MDALRALLEEKKKVAASDYGGRKYVKQSEIEGARLKRLREEEANELSQKVRRRPCYQSGSATVCCVGKRAAIDQRLSTSSCA